MADAEASVRELGARDHDCTERALTQMDLRRKLKLLIEEWKAAGGSHVLADIPDCVRPRPANGSGR